MSCLLQIYLTLSINFCKDFVFVTVVVSNRLFLAQPAGAVLLPVPGPQPVSSERWAPSPRRPTSR